MKTAILFALLALILTASGALAHGSEDTSLAHRILDSALIPVLGLAALAFVSLSLWRTRGRQQQ